MYQRGQFGRLTLNTFSGAFTRFKGLNMPFERLYARRVFGRNLSGPLCKLSRLPFSAGFNPAMKIASARMWGHAGSAFGSRVTL